MTTFKFGAQCAKNGMSRDQPVEITGTGINRNQWQKGWDWEHFNPSGDKPAGFSDRADNGIRSGEIQRG